ncbi:MAG: hypothetical protein H0W25_07730, partial [Acidimicrobiia bacterium]|nr:hypothetical protein [Acidimicrobiia bacterium]
MRFRPDFRARRRRRAAAGLGLLLAAVTVGGATPDVGAQEGSGLTDLSEQFGGFELSGRASGLQVSYDLRNVLPLPAPLLLVSAPEAQSGMTTGPGSTALASLAYPGNVLANLPSVVAQGAPEVAAFIPPYPILTRAEYPAGPPEASQDIGTASSSVNATDAVSDAFVGLADADIPGLVTVGSISTTTSTALLTGSVESRARVEFSDVSILFGLLHIDSIVTDLVANTDASASASAGSTTIAGATLLGLPITIGPDGIVGGPPPSGPGDPNPLTPITENLPGLGPVSDALNGVTGPLNELIRSALGTSTATLNDLLAAAGITVKVAEPTEVLEAGSAERTAAGVVVELVFDGSGDNPLAQLLALIPTDQLPTEGLPGIPLNTSPQALVKLLKETSVVGFGMAAARVAALASAPFEFVPPAVTPGGSITPAVGGGSSTVPPVRPGFNTPSPSLAPSTTPASGGTA